MTGARKSKLLMRTSWGLYVSLTLGALVLLASDRQGAAAILALSGLPFGVVGGIALILRGPSLKPPRGVTWPQVRRAVMLRGVVSTGLCSFLILAGLRDIFADNYLSAAFLGLVAIAAGVMAIRQFQLLELIRSFPD
jgi:hypothetical protein